MSLVILIIIISCSFLINNVMFDLVSDLQLINLNDLEAKVNDS
jgi:hypothetical protein